MLRSPHRCPCCSQPLGINCDMWGDFYVCADCGFTAEDDDELKVGAKLQPFVPFLQKTASPASAESGIRPRRVI